MGNLTFLRLTHENGTGGLGRKQDSYGVLASRTDP
jgi:hypothetical protein